MPGDVAMTIVSPAKMRGKNLRFLPTSFPFHSTPSPPITLFHSFYPSPFFRLPSPYTLLPPPLIMQIYIYLFISTDLYV